MWGPIRAIVLTFAVAAPGLITISSSSGLSSSFTYCNATEKWICDITCQNYGVCFENTAKKFEFHEIEKCSKSCTERGCSNDPLPSDETCFRNSGTIGCLTPGIYPDPYNSRRSLHCSENGVVSVCNECDKGCYNSISKDCVDETENGQCSSSLEIVCRKFSDVHVIPNDERYYFICLRDSNENLYPLMDKCEVGNFNIDSKSCVVADTGVTVTDKVAEEIEEKCEYINSSTSTTSTTTPTITTTTTTTESEECHQSGDIIYDPDDCTEYFVCDGKSKVHMSCFPGQFFNRKFKVCVDGDCPYVYHINE